MTTFGTPEPFLQAELAYRRERLLSSTRTAALRRRLQPPRPAARTAALHSAGARRAATG